MRKELIKKIKSYDKHIQLFREEKIELINDFYEKTGLEIKFLARDLENNYFGTKHYKLAFSINDDIYIMFYKEDEYGDTIYELFICEAKKELKVTYVLK